MNPVKEPVAEPAGAAVEVEPYIPASRSLPELTLQAVALGLVLSVVMCAANIYVGLKAGMTVSAAIPASVISMGVLRGLLRRGNILENNIVHTIASSGESLAAGIIFTIPALVLAGVWTEFHYWETTLIGLAGGLMGVVMMIPLRRAMIVEQKELRYPEGVACAEVLKAGDRGGAQMMGIFTALGLGAAFKACIGVLGVIKGTVEGSVQVGKTAVYAGTDISPMLMAVGFIVGWEIALLVFLGGAISFLGAIPYFAWDADLGAGSLTDGLLGIWDTKIRYFGIGAMIVAGVASIIKVGGSMAAGVRTAVRGIRGQEETASLPRTEQNITGRSLFALLALCVVLTAFAYSMMTGSAVVTAISTAVMFVLAFFFVAVASYIVGLVGSSNSPVSGMTICAVLVTAGLLLVLGYSGTAGFIATLGVAGVVCCAACTSGDICQDLKIGQIVGATPRRLQIGELIGTATAAFIIAPVMTLLHRGYGIGKPAREGVDALPAPQGAMFEKLVGGLFPKAGETGAIPWDIVAAGAAVGVAVLLIDAIFLAPRKAKFRLYAMPLAVGMYLPWTVTVPILFGGIAYWYVERASRRRGDPEAVRQGVIHRGLLFSSGLVAGEAIMGILIAFLLIANLKIPLLQNWAKGALAPDHPFAVYLRGEGNSLAMVSLAAFLVMIVLLVRKSLAREEIRP
jgi:putative OPT family oligopeptide transporter